MIKVSIFKTSADGEQINCEVELNKEHLDALKPHRQGNEIIPGKPLREQLDFMFQLADDRLLEMNKRIMASNVLVKRLSPEAQYAVHNIFEVLHGRSRGPAPEAILEEAKQEREAAQAKANQEVPE